jgi:hypothetical protein
MSKATRREKRRARKYEVTPAPKPPEVGPLSPVVAFPDDELIVTMGTYEPFEVTDYAGFNPIGETVNGIADDGAESFDPAKFEAEALKAEISQQLIEWWMDKANTDVTQLVDKMIEYGGLGRASDLAEIGVKMIELGMPKPDSTEVVDYPAYAAEVGIYFYMVGKMSRWSAALEAGRQVSDDTIHDLKIYATMVQRIREAGGWPV